MKQKGQVVLILILIMSVALAIGLSIVQKSLVDVSTASKVEQSSRAFSAAEAGVEKALKESDTILHSTVSFSGNSSAVKGIIDTGLIPAVAEPGNQQAPLEIPPLAKEEVTQVWLADFNSVANPPADFYTQNTLNVYWGNSSEDKAALELTLIYYGTNQNPPAQADTADPATIKYRSIKWYLDQIARNPENRFEVVPTCLGNYQPSGGLSTYQCTKTLAALPSGLILIRARLLYNTTSQPFAVQAVVCPASPCRNYSIPPQARIVVSTGTSGETERRVKVFQQDKVLPPYFDYAIFSAGDITK